MSILKNKILRNDSYKLSHFGQYPTGTTEVSSYVEPRGSNIEGVTEVCWFGPQPYIMDVLLEPITMEEVNEAALLSEAHGEPFNREGWEYIVREHKGFLPIEIRAVPEGTIVPIHNLCAMVRNLDEKCAWLTSYIETDFLRACWYGTTVATVSRTCKQIIYDALVQSGEDPEAEINFKLHDFGARGVSSFESAGIGAAAHLINFMGTDTITGIGHAMQYYGAGVVGFSIPAAEHSTMTLRGRDGEQASYQAMIDAYAAPGKIFAVVSDSYDIYNAVENIWVKAGLLEQVKNKGATVVIRPDSGDPLEVPVKIIHMLWELLPEKLVNAKGYRILPPYVRVIQGDGITIDSLPKILSNLMGYGYSASNIGFGMGGGLLQHVNRDTFKFAMKASHAYVNGKGVDVYKEPVGQPDKKSKRGLLDLYKIYNPVGGHPVYRTFASTEIVRDSVSGSECYHPIGDDSVSYHPVTEVIFSSYRGKVTTNFTTFDEIRQRAKIKL